MKLLITTTRQKSRGVYQTWLLQYKKRYDREWDCGFIMRCDVYWSRVLQYRKSITGDETVDLLLDVVCFEAGYYNTEKAGQGIWLWIYYEMWCVLKQVIPKKYDREWDCWFITRCGVFRSRLFQYRKKYDGEWDCWFITRCGTCVFKQSITRKESYGRWWNILWTRTLQYHVKSDSCLLKLRSWNQRESEPVGLLLGKGAELVSRWILTSCQLHVAISSVEAWGSPQCVAMQSPGWWCGDVRVIMVWEYETHHGV